MAGAGVTQSICLPLLSVYQLSTNGTVQVSASGLPGGWDCLDRTSSGKMHLEPPSLAPEVVLFNGLFTTLMERNLPRPTLTSSQRSSHSWLVADPSLEPRILLSLPGILCHCWPWTLSGPPGCQVVTMPIPGLFLL